MPRLERVRHEFVEYVPGKLEEGVLYVSMTFATSAHLCCCGCGHEVVTPLTPTDWELIFNGESVSLYPSIGNWSFRCRSHYWIRRGRVVWARSWSDSEIAVGRLDDRHRKDAYYGHADDALEEVAASAEAPVGDGSVGVWERLTGWWRRRGRRPPSSKGKE